MPDTADRVIGRLDELVDGYCRRTRFFNEPISTGRARTWVMQHRLNTRQRNSVLKLRVATNCPDWDVRLQSVSACADEVIADEKYGHGKPHWQHLEELGMWLGMKREEVQNAKPLDSTLICWAAWEGLMSNRHWLEGRRCQHLRRTAQRARIRDRRLQAMGTQRCRTPPMGRSLRLDRRAAHLVSNA